MAQQLKSVGNKQLLELNLEGLKPKQIRLIRSLVDLVRQVNLVQDEAEYFEMSAELLKVATNIIKNGNFPKDKDQGIDYSAQVLEYCLDFLGEDIFSEKAIRYDN